MSASGAECGRTNSSALPATANQAASPVSQSETSAPLARAALATVNAWAQRSGSLAPAITFTTNFFDVLIVEL